MRGLETAAPAVFSLLRRQRGALRWLESSNSSISSMKPGELARTFQSFAPPASSPPPLPPSGPGLKDFLPPSAAPPPRNKRPVPPPPPRQAIPGVAHIIAVSSGKGGVGKSTVAGKSEGGEREREKLVEVETKFFLSFCLNLLF